MYRDNITKKPVQDNASTASRKLVFAIVICFVFMTGETIGGYISGSVAILTDAAHLLADVTGFAISLFSIWLGSKGSNPTLSYGFKRAEILGAMLSIIVIWVLTGVLVVEAAHRTGQILGFNRANTADKLTPVVYVDGKIMFIVAVIGLCCNLVLLKLLGHDHGHGGHGHHHGHSHGGHGHGSHDHDESHSHGSHDHDESHGHGSHDHDESHGHGHSQHSPSKISTHNTDYPNVEGSPHLNTDIESNKEQGSRIQVYPHSNTESTPLLASAVVAAAAVGNGDDGQYGSVVQGNKEDHKQKQLKQRKSRFENINISAAYAHAIGDLIQSIGVCIAGALIWAMPGDQYPMVQLADPIATFLFSILVLYSTIVVLQTSVMVLMEAAPADLDLSSIMKDIASIAGVSDVHDLHIWSVTHGDLALTVHVTTDPEVATEIQILRAVQHKLRARGIEHSTIQVEVGSSPICEASQCSEDGENTYSCEGYAFKCADHKCNDLKFV